MCKLEAIDRLIGIAYDEEQFAARGNQFNEFLFETIEILVLIN